MSRHVSGLLWGVLLSAGLVAHLAHAQDDNREAQAAVKKLQSLLVIEYPLEEHFRVTQTLIAEIAKSKSQQARRTVYDAVFYWLGYDDTFTSHPKLFKLKERLEQDYAKRAKAAAAGLKNLQTASFVFLHNRAELAKDLSAERQLRVLVLVRTTDDLTATTALKKRELIARKLKLPVDDVGLIAGVEAIGLLTSHVDPRFQPDHARGLLECVCPFFEYGFEPPDRTFLHWAIENRVLDEETANRFVPYVLDPQFGLSKIELEDSQFLAVKLFKLVGPQKLETLARETKSFQQFAADGTLSPEDLERAKRSGLDLFWFHRNYRYSQRYAFHFNHVVSLEINQRGEIVDPRRESETSTDLAADVKLMWSGQPNGDCSQEALEAASRVFNTVRPKGQTRLDLVKLLGDPDPGPPGTPNSRRWLADRHQVLFLFHATRMVLHIKLEFDDRDVCISASEQRFDPTICILPIPRPRIIAWQPLP